MQLGAARAQVAAVEAAFEELQDSTRPTVTLAALETLGRLDYTDVSSDLFYDILWYLKDRVQRGDPPQFVRAALRVVAKFEEFEVGELSTYASGLVTDYLHGRFRLLDCSSATDEMTYLWFLELITVADRRDDTHIRSRDPAQRDCLDTWTMDRRFEVMGGLIRGENPRVAPDIAARSLASSLDELARWHVSEAELLATVTKYETILTYRHEHMAYSVAALLGRQAGNHDMLSNVAKSAPERFKREYVLGAMARVRSHVPHESRDRGLHADEVREIEAIMAGLFEPEHILWMAPEFRQIPYFYQVAHIADLWPGDVAVAQGVAESLTGSERDILSEQWQELLGSWIDEYPVGGFTFEGAERGAEELFRALRPLAGEYAADIELLLGD